MKTVVALLLLISPAAAGGPDQGDAPDAARADGEAVQRVGGAFALERLAQRVLEGFRGSAGWGEYQPHLVAALEQIYAQNDWNSESDDFSLDVAREVSAIPPWEIAARVEAVNARLTGRYALSEGQREALGALLTRESGAVLTAHAPRLMLVIMEVLHTRLAGEPFTAEQVARWTQAAEPVLADARRRLEARVPEFLAMLDPEQREWVRVDLAAASRRLDRITELGRAWQLGRWDPADWGLQGDPIQRGEWRGPDGAAAVVRDMEGAAPGEERGAGAGSTAAAMDASTPLPGGRPAQPGVRGGVEDPDPWAAYVREFIGRYKLDAAQRQRAWIIYDSARQRRDLQQRRFDARIARQQRTVATSDSGSAREALSKLEHAAGAARQQVFEELRRRLDRLPTRAQRRDAGPPPHEDGAASHPAASELGGP